MTQFIQLSSRVSTLLHQLAFTVAMAALVLNIAAERYGWLDFKPGGTAFDADIRPIFIITLAVSVLLALRWKVIGGVLAAFAGAALIAFATNQLVTAHAVFVIVIFVVPAVLWIIIDLNDFTPAKASIGLAFALLAAVSGYIVGERIYDHYWGPTHPESPIAELPDSELDWIWSGSVTSTTAEVRARPSGDVDGARLAVARADDFTDPVWFESKDTVGRVLGFDLTGLQPDTTYHYAVEVDGQLDVVRNGRLRTFPQGASSFSVAIGSCARVGSNGRVFDTIRELDPLLYLVVGDLHYGDNGRNDVRRFEEVMDLTLSQPAQAALYRSTPISYMWDDHDYGGNDADGSSPSRQAAMAAYREYVPSYDLSGAESAVYQAYTVGRVRVILTDARSARDESAGTMLGPEQKAWFKDELVAAAGNEELIIWVNPVPWVDEEREGADSWGGFAAERRELADFIADNHIENLLMVSGDAHMVAIDDGTNTDYSSSGGAGFPLLHASALDRNGSVKGGPYSEGVVAGGGQFATVDIDDSGDAIDVTLTGLNWNSEVLMKYEFTTS